MATKDMSIPILDHGYIKLIDWMGGDESIIEAARMSTGRGFEGWDKDAGLLEFLWRNRHTSPFEMPEIIIEVQAPLFVFREWHRHRTQSYNEFSARYAQMPNLHYLPEASRMAKQSNNNKQASGLEVIDRHVDEILKKFEEEQAGIYNTYDWAIEQGLAKEVARVNTPVSRYSKMRAKTDLSNWLKFLNLRMRPNAQYEIRQYADALGKIISEIFPRTWSLFEEYDLYGAHMSRTEMCILRDLLKHVPGVERVADMQTDGLGGGDMTKLEFIGITAQNNLNKSRLADFLQKIEFGGIKIL